jgi:capsular polysaccharide transport system permease protein
MGFTVRAEGRSAATELLGGRSILSNASGSDSSALYEFLQSQSMVERINRRLDLSKIFSRPVFDPVFAYDPNGTIEDLLEYWKDMVRVSYDKGTGLMEVEVHAFAPADAKAINDAILDESTQMINQMTEIGRRDATIYAKEELGVALSRLKSARKALIEFQSKTRIVDPRADLQGQMGLLNSLDAQLAQAYIELNMALETSSSEDPRMVQARRRIVVIQNLIEQERTKFGSGDSDPNGTAPEADYPTLVGEFERLNVDVEYASKAYLTAMAALDIANAQAQRQSRYLATYSQPSLPQAALFPKRGTLLATIGMFLVLIWATCIMIYYSVRDRR